MNINRIIQTLALALVAGAFFFSSSSYAAESCTPPQEWAVWNEADKHASMTISGLNAQVVDNANSLYAVRADKSYSTGKSYFEVTINSGTLATGNESWIGVATTGQTLSNYPGSSADGWAYGSGGGRRNNGSGGSGSSYQGGDKVMVFVDHTAGKIWFGKNGTWSGDPNGGTGAAFSNVAGSVFPIFGSADHPSYPGYAITANFGESAWAYTPPTGAVGWFTEGECEEEEPPPEEGEGPYICSEVTDGECTAFAPYVETLATWADLDLTGETLGLAFAWGLGIILVFFGLGFGFGSIHKVLESTLGGRYDS